MSKRKMKIVQPVTEKKPENAKQEAPVPTAVIEQPQVHTEAPKQEPQARAPSIMDILQNTDPKMLQTAQQLGIPLKPLMEWAVNMEAIVKAQSEALQTLGVKLGPLINLAQRAQQEQQQIQQNPATAQGGGGGLRDLIAIAKEAGIIGGGGDSFSQELQKEMFATAIENMRLGNAMLRGMVTQTFPKMAAEVMKKGAEVPK